MYIVSLSCPSIMSELQPQPNKVSIDTVELWKNRPYSEWHKPFPDSFGTLSGCFNGNCPHENHWSERSYDDPQARPLIDSLQRGQRMLLLTDYCEIDHVDYATLDHVHEMGDGYKELIFQEKSNTCYFLKPPKYQWNGFPLNIHWRAVRYTALVDNPDIASFGKYGGKPLFKRELARVSGASMREINQAVTELDAMNNPVELPIRMRVPQATWLSSLYEKLEAGDAEEFKGTLDFLAEYKTPLAALTLGIITQQGRLDTVKALVPDWTPPKPDALKEGLEIFGNWFTKSVPGSEAQVQEWMGQWDQTFKLQSTLTSGN